MVNISGIQSIMFRRKVQLTWREVYELVRESKVYEMKSNHLTGQLYIHIYESGKNDSHITKIHSLGKFCVTAFIFISKAKICIRISLRDLRDEYVFHRHFSNTLFFQQLNQSNWNGDLNPTFVGEKSRITAR